MVYGFSLSSTAGQRWGRNPTIGLIIRGPFPSKVFIGRSRLVPMNPSRHDFFDPLIKIFKMNLFVVAGIMYLTIVNVSDHSDTFK